MFVKLAFNNGLSKSAKTTELTFAHAPRANQLRLTGSAFILLPAILLNTLTLPHNRLSAVDDVTARFYAANPIKAVR
jgi:hypothetical protein